MVIANALDHMPAEARRSRVERELAALADLGFDAVELDLRHYFGQEQQLCHDLAEVSVAGLTGGNVFMLRYALSPHYRSPGHPESAAMEVVVARYRAEGTADRTLHDGQALVINGPDTAVV